MTTLAIDRPLPSMVILAFAYFRMRAEPLTKCHPWKREITAAAGPRPGLINAALGRVLASQLSDERPVVHMDGLLSA